MKINKQYLQKIILEETRKLLAEEKDTVNLAGKPIETAFEAKHLIDNPQGLGMYQGKNRSDNEPYLTDFSRHVGHVLMMANFFATSRAEGLSIDSKGDAEFENRVRKKISEIGLANYYPANKQLQIELYTDIYFGFLEIRSGGDQERLSGQTLGAARAAIYNQYESILSKYKIGNEDPAKIINDAAAVLYKYNQLIASQLSELGEGLAGKFNALLKEVDQKAIAQKSGQAPPFVSLSDEEEEAAAKATAAKLDAEFKSKYGTGERGKEKFGAAAKGVQTTGTAAQMTATGAGAPLGKGGVERTIGNLEEQKKENKRGNQMKITREYLKRVIKEELGRVLREGPEKGQKYILTQPIVLDASAGVRAGGATKVEKGEYIVAFAEGPGSEGQLELYTVEGNPVGNSFSNEWFREQASKGIFKRYNETPKGVTHSL